MAIFQKEKPRERIFLDEKRTASRKVQPPTNQKVIIKGKLRKRKGKEDKKGYKCGWQVGEGAGHVNRRIQGGREHTRHVTTR